MITLKPSQWKVFNCNSRFRVLVAGRRFGKTYLALVELVRAAWKSGRLAWYVAPTYKQAKRVAWKPLKEMTRPYWASKPNETDLRIELITGGTICLRGADNYDSLRGDGLDFLVLDEYASMAPAAWTEVLRPALADREGRALFIGTPKGFNNFYDLYDAAQGRPQWSTFQFTTEQGGNVSLEELETATLELDEKTYRQEFQARFDNIATGRAYYAFDRSLNVAPVGYFRNLPLFWALDFNINPMCSVIGQQDGEHIRVLDEISIPDCNTNAACEAFHQRLEPLTQNGLIIPIDVYGDAAGDSRHSSASRTDWQLVRMFFNGLSHLYKPTFHLSSANPAVKDRINCVNARLRNQAGQRRLTVDPQCKQLIRDFEQVLWKTDTNGNPLSDIDKSDPARTHVSDALGYMIAKVFPMRSSVGFRPERLL